MAAPKMATENENAARKVDGPSVYEIAMAAAREAKRLNDGFCSAKEMPPENVVVTALRRVKKGDVAYKMADEDHVDGSA